MSTSPSLLLVSQAKLVLGFGNPEEPLLGSRKPGKTRIVDNVGHFVAIVMVNLWKRYAQKLHKIILLQFELITFRFAYGRNQNSSFP